MNRLSKLFDTKSSHILNVYVTAGYPHINSSIQIVKQLEDAGADIVELGMPYSDPLADGETIQNSSTAALKNGMNLRLLFEQVKTIRSSCEIPIVLMGYYNQMLQFGVQKFIDKCSSVGVDGLIVPDLPMDIYEAKYKSIFETADLTISFLVSPHTADQRVQKAASLSSSFLYVVSQSSITGAKKDIQINQQAYFERIAHLAPKTPRLIGFGIHNHDTYAFACKHAHGAIIGSEFIRKIENLDIEDDHTVPSFVQSIKQ